MKSSKAMSHIQLIVTIIILVILICTSVYFIIQKINDVKIDNLKTNMLLIEWKVKEFDEKKKMNKDENYIGIKLSEILDNEIINEFKEKTVLNEDEYEKYYVLDDECLNKFQLELSNDEQSYFLVNYETQEVIYTKGYKYKDLYYYKLSDFNKIFGDIDKIKQVKTEEDNKVEEEAVVESETENNENESVEE